MAIWVSGEAHLLLAGGVVDKNCLDAVRHSYALCLHSAWQAGSAQNTSISSEGIARGMNQ